LPDFTVVIAHRGPALGLWATIQSCEIDLAQTGFSYNYVLVLNGTALEPDVSTKVILEKVGKLEPDLCSLLHFVRESGKLHDMIHSVPPLSPPTARQLGTEKANGEYLFFLDNHCLVKPGYFNRAMSVLKERGMDVLHSTTRYYHGDEDQYHYDLSLDRNFWGGGAVVPQDSENPYRIAVGGHGGFVVRRSTWEEVGGYGPLGLFVGYGGEEVYFDMKMWMLGKENWIDPKLVHYHYAGNRGYRRHYTDDFYCNMMMCAFIVGGESWMYKVQDSFSTRYTRYASSKTMFDLMMEAHERGKEHAKWLAERRCLSLDELLDWFRTEQIPF